MMKRLDRKDLLALGICLLLIVLVFGTHVLDKRQTWGTMEWTYMDFIKQDRTNPHYGIQNSGPKFNLPAGDYELKFTIATDGGGHVRLSTTNDAPIEPNAFAFDASQTEQVVSFTILESAKQVEIRVDFEYGTYYKMGETRLYTPYYRDRSYTFALALLLGWLLAVFLRHGWVSREGREALILLTIAVLFASVPALKENLSVFHDTRYHAARLRNLAQGLAQGQFPVRLGAFSYNGYGAITSVFYPDLFLLPFALLLLGGASLQYAMNLILVFGNALAAVLMVRCAKRIWKDAGIALLAAIIYELAVYRVTDGSVRFAVGELLAMGFLPLFIEGLYEVALGEKRRWPVLALGAAAVFMSHMLSTFLCALMAVAFCLPLAGKLFREKRIVKLLLAAGCAALLCLFYILPMLTYTRQGIGPDASMFTTTMAGTSIAPAQLFLQGAGNLAAVPEDRTISFMPLELGLPLWLGVAALLLVLSREGVRRASRELRIALLFLAVGAWFTFMSTTLFPWNYVAVVTKLFERVQFAYRYLMFPAAFFSLAGAWALARIAEERQRALLTLGMLALCVVTILPTISAQTRLDEVYAFGLDVSPDIKQFTEYCLPGADMAATRYRAIETTEGVTFTDVQRRGSEFTGMLEAEQAGTLALPLFGFDGYEARLNGQALDWHAAEGGRLVIEVPTGARGELRVFFAGKRFWRVGDAVSLVTAGVMLFTWIRKKKRAALLQSAASSGQG